MGFYQQTRDVSRANPVALLGLVLSSLWDTEYLDVRCADGLAKHKVTLSVNTANDDKTYSGQPT